jgi:hypothetical protein
MNLDLLIALGQELAAVLPPPWNSEVTVQDAFEIWRSGLAQPPTVPRLHALTDADVRALADAANRHFETGQAVTPAMISTWLDGVRARWPSG